MIDEFSGATFSFIDTAADTITINQLNVSGTLNSTSSPAVSDGAAIQKALSAGAATIDLTAVTGYRGVTKDFTGLRLQLLFLHNPSTNANNITVTFGASNPYNALGASFLVVLTPGQRMLFYGDNDTPAVAAGAKNIDLAGTGSQVLNVIMTFG